MAKDQKINTYELSGNKYVKSTTEQPMINDQAKAVLDSGKAAFLRENPFLYNSQSASYPVTSIEEFLIKIHKEEIAFGDVLRNPRFSFRKRRKIIKNSFKTWDKDYNQKKLEAFKENDKTVEVIGGVNFLKLSLKTKILIYLMFAFMIIIVAPTSSLWEKVANFSLFNINIGYSVNMIILNTFETTSWLKVVANISIYLLLIMIFYSSIYNVVTNDFTKDYRLAQNFLSKSEKTISYQYKKKFKKAYSYYMRALKNRKNKFFAPLDIKEIEEGQVNIDTFNTICQATIDRAYNVKKKKPYYLALKTLLMVLSIGTSGTVIGYIIVKTAMSVFNL